jgi:hypothetical protein
VAKIAAGRFYHHLRDRPIEDSLGLVVRPGIFIRGDDQAEVVVGFFRCKVRTAGFLRLSWPDSWGYIPG